jgi:hypothetical protein
MKYTTVAVIKNTMMELTIVDRLINVVFLPSLPMKPTPERSENPQPLVSAPGHAFKIGVMMAPTKLSTTLANAVPTTTAIARSTTLPRITNALNPLIICAFRCL